ncbi:MULTISPECIES: LexA family protein [Enterococcus]|nr:MULTISPECIES: XRE family transcriptional regulator [Enterococcus]ALF50621.1 XRE family transcriptional regulator [Enterococcus faecium]ALL10560.1 XRE family transcriptional regulator [Enterococcus faecium]MDG4618914.1 XRE family transcriptional regulator [Enterococcus lactis]MDG4626409.1 XRE family transcriptional regulator [Enterococcus lactis]MDP4513012.1 XRE family transcriptional regulator [Enterococcus faecium]
MARGELTPQEIENRKKISANINKLIKEKNVSQVDIHNHTKIPKSTLTGYVKGTSTPNPGNVQKLADFFNVKKSEIDPRFKPIPNNVIPILSSVKIPVLGEIACGEPILAEENIDGYIEEFADKLPSGELFYLKTKGDSMMPTIPENSYVMIRKQPDVEEGEIAAVVINGDNEATLKRVKRQNGLTMLIPDNTDYKPYIITESNPATILGKAVKVSFNL